MSKTPYPTSYKEYEKHIGKGQPAIDENNDHSQGGPGSLPDQQYDAADVLTDGAKGWRGDQSAFE